jgi:thymidylate synthase
MHRGIVDNGMVGVLYDPAMWLWDEKPCWNWVQVEYLGDGKLALRLLFRSHDYSTGMWANLSFILYMMRHFVAAPCNCEIVEVTLFSSNAHIYEGDQDNATKVAGIPWLREENESFIGRIRRCLRLK